MYRQFFLLTALFLFTAGALGPFHRAVGGENATANVKSEQCRVFDPFRVVPDFAKFQLGGSFAIHEVDCLTIKPETVQEVVAVQWALSHFNQNPDNADARMGLFAGDSCSRSKEAISQTLRFLDTVGYLEPEECLASQRQSQPKMVGILAPKGDEAAVDLGSLLRPTKLPIGVYDRAAFQALLRSEAVNIVSSVPSIGTYLEVFVRLMRALDSDLVAVVDAGDDATSTEPIVQRLKENGVQVTEIISVAHPLLTEILAESDASIILSLVSNKVVLKQQLGRQLLEKKKIWVTLPLAQSDDDSMDVVEGADASTKLQVVNIRQRFAELRSFQNYFTRVLINNYDSYPLLASYIQQVFNCSLNQTADSKELESCASLSAAKFAQRSGRPFQLESIVKLTYAFAVAGKQLAPFAAMCTTPNDKCSFAVVEELLRLNYTFGTADPPEFRGDRLQFFKSSDGVLMMAGVRLEAVLVEREGRQGAQLYKLLEYETGAEPRVHAFTLPKKIRGVHSACQPYRSYCGKCERVTRLPDEKAFLSIPKLYPLYLTGIFDLHEGPNCDQLRSDGIAMPLSFVYTMWTFRQRYPQLNLLPNVEFGALLVDGCASVKSTTDFVVESENRCYRFTQSDRNITIVPGSTIGYLPASPPATVDVLHKYLSADASGKVPLVALSGDATESGVFSAAPSHRAQAVALLRYLKAMQWDFVSVLLNDEDAESLAAYKHFDRMALDYGVCVAEVLSVASTAQLKAPGALRTSTNVTLVFASATEAAAFLSGKLRLGDGAFGNSVYVMVGDSHDFHLHDRTNLAHYVGVVSVQPKNALHGDFREWLETITPLTLPEQWFWNYMEERWKCALSMKNRDRYYGRLCTGEELLNVGELGRMTKAGHLARGLERLLFAADSVYKRLCPEKSGVCAEFFAKGRQQIAEVLARGKIDEEFEVYEFLPLDHHGNFGYEPVANFSLAKGLKQIAAYKTFVNGAPRPGFHRRSKCLPPLCKCFLGADPSSFLLNANPSSMAAGAGEQEASSQGGSYVRQEPVDSGRFADAFTYDLVLEQINGGNWRAQPLSYILLGLTSAFLLIAVIILALVCIKTLFRVVKGNQSLGISLLVGVILMFVAAYAFIFDPSEATCRARVILHGLAHTICFGVMIVKAVQLRNAESLGLKHQIGYFNYWLLLCFIVAVQIALSSRWATVPRMVAWLIDGNDTRLACAFTKEDFLGSQAYTIVLLLISLFLNSLNRKIKRNYKETKWLFVSSVACTALFVAWIVLYGFSSYDYKEYIVVLELHLCGMILLAFLFGPKLYILLSYEPVVVECHADSVSHNLSDKDIHLFESDELRKGAVSPAGSTRTCGSPVSKYNVGAASPNLSHLCSDQDDQPPLFQTVMRKKRPVRRSQSQQDQAQYRTLSPSLVHAYPSPPYSPSESCRSGRVSSIEHRRY